MGIAKPLERFSDVVSSIAIAIDLDHEIIAPVC